MKIDGIKLQEGSSISNLTVNSGMSFPPQTDIGEIFYKTDPSTTGLYVYNGTTWNRLADSTSVLDGLGFTPVNRAGDTMTGQLVLAADPATALGAVTKQYSDDQFTRVNKVSRLALVLAVVAIALGIFALVN